MVCMAAAGMGSLGFIVDATVWSVHIQNTMQIDHDFKDAVKATPDNLKAKKRNILQWPSKFTDLNPMKACFSFTKDKTEQKSPKHKQQFKSAKGWQIISRKETQDFILIFSFCMNIY